MRERARAARGYGGPQAWVLSAVLPGPVEGHKKQNQGREHLGTPTPAELAVCVKSPQGRGGLGLMMSLSGTACRSFRRGIIRWHGRAPSAGDGTRSPGHACLKPHCSGLPWRAEAPGVGPVHACVELIALETLCLRY